MDTATLVSGLLSARMGQVQLAVAAKMVRMNAEAGASVADLIDSAQRNLNQLVNAARGVGQAVDISV